MRCYFCALIFHSAVEISSLASSGGTSEIPAVSCGIFDVTNSSMPQFPTEMATQAQSQSSSQEMQPIVATRNNLAKNNMCRPSPSDSLQVKVWTDKDSRNGCRIQLCGSFVPEAKPLSVWRIHPIMLELPRSCWIEHSTD
jgi:hypothetical protein